jgi:hypothetical protein
MARPPESLRLAGLCLGKVLRTLPVALTGSAATTGTNNGHRAFELEVDDATLVSLPACKLTSHPYLHAPPAHAHNTHTHTHTHTHQALGSAEVIFSTLVVAGRPILRQARPVQVRREAGRRAGGQAGRMMGGRVFVWTRHTVVRERERVCVCVRVRV